MTQDGAVTSEPATPPVFWISKVTFTRGRCSQIAVEEPSAMGVALPAAHAFSSEAEVASS